MSEMTKIEKLEAQNSEMYRLLKKLRVILMQAGYHDDALSIDGLLGEEAKPQKFYEVELKRVSYVTLTIEADSPEEAEEKAWKELENDNVCEDASWEIESIEELK
jgi:hypothetical protein